MLSEEEKKAIDYLTKYTRWETYGERNLDTDIETALKIIKRQFELLNKIEKYAAGINDTELLLILHSNEIEDLFKKCKTEGLINE